MLEVLLLLNMLLLFLKLSGLVLNVFVGGVPQALVVFIERRDLRVIVLVQFFGSAFHAYSICLVVFAFFPSLSGKLVAVFLMLPV